MPTSRDALGFLAFGALLCHPLASPAQPEARDEVVDIVYWDEDAGPEMRRWAFITGFITEFDADGHIRGTRSATFKYDAAHDGQGPPAPVAAAYFPAVGEPIAVGDARRAVAMALDEATGDFYITAPAANPGRAIIKYDKSLLPAWASPVRSLGAVNGEPVEISLDPDRGLVVVSAGDEVIALDAADGSISRHMPEATNPKRGGLRSDRAGEDRVGPAPLAAFAQFASPAPHPALAAPSLAQEQCEPVWSGLNGGAGFWVRALGALDEDGPGPLPPALFAGGGFSALAGVTSHYVARWDGWTASKVGKGLLANVAGVAHVEPVPEPAGLIPAGLYVGGVIVEAGGIPVNNIARWLSPDWHDVGGGVKSFHPNVIAFVAAARLFDEDGDGPLPPALFVGGQFEFAGGVPIDALARWDGQNWSAVGGGLSTGIPNTYPTVYALEVFDDDGPGPRPPALYIGGSFLYAAGMPAYNIVRWDGAAFETVAGGSAVGLNGSVNTLFVFDEDGPGPKLPALFAGGSFNGPMGNAGTLWGLGRWDGKEWSSVGGWQGGDVEAMLVWDADGPGPAKDNLYVGGLFNSIPGYLNNVGKIARWDGEKWWPLGAGLTGFGAGTHVSAIAAFDEDGDGPNRGGLYVGGLFY